MQHFVPIKKQTMINGELQFDGDRGGDCGTAARHGKFKAVAGSDGRL